MKKAIWIVLGVLGALGLGLVGLILACHFKPGLSDAIASKLYKDRPKQQSEGATLTDEEDAELDSLSVADLTGVLDEPQVTDEDGNLLLDENGNIAVPEGAGDADSPGPGETVVVTPVELRSLADYGLTQEDVINNMQDYFDDCYDQLSAYKGQSTSFYNVVRDSMIGAQVLQSYDDESYRDGFMNRFMDDYKVDTCGWSVDEEELQGGYILVKHNFTR